MESDPNFNFPKRSSFIEELIEETENLNEERYKKDPDVTNIANELKKMISRVSQEIDSKCKKQSDLVSSLYRSNPKSKDLEQALISLDECSNGKSAMLQSLAVNTQIMQVMFKTQENLCLDDCEKNSGNNKDLLKSCVKNCISYNYYSYKAIDTITYEFLKSSQI